MQIWDIVRFPVESEKGGTGAPSDSRSSFEPLNGDMQISLLDAAVLEEAPQELAVADPGGGPSGIVRKKDLLYFLQFRERTGLLESVMDRLDVGIIAADRDGRIFYANQAYEKLLGVPVYKVAGRNIFRIEPDSDLCEALRTGRNIVNESKYVKSVKRYVSLHIHVLRDEQEKKLLGAVSVFTDVTRIRSLHTEIARMSGMVDEFRQQLEETYRDTGVITRDRDFMKLMKQAEVAARTDVPILIRGENGVGKEVVARFIHKVSGRKDQPLVVVNCASIPESLIESELFGYEEGAFTGAKRGGKMGKFELANHGTIFLDEIGDMPVSLQPRLLRVIQNGEIEKIGRQRTVPVDVRIIAATNQPLEELIREKRFREDLFFRLNVISLSIPALRNRPEDIPLLAEHFLREFTAKYTVPGQPEKKISARGYRRLMQHRWSGNVRELQNCIERAVILGTEEVLDFEELAAPAPGAGEESRTGTGPETSPGPEPERGHGSESQTGHSESETSLSTALPEAMAQYESRLIREALQACGGNRQEAVQRLGISRRSFYRKCAEYGLLEK